nr:MAG TPA: minor tail protein [Caudoviricetes sp.]
MERNITITITTVYKTVGKSSSGSSSSSRSGRASARSVSLPMQNIPALARGAVIPPNREFLAVLGDQKSGTNVEAPLDTIVQAVMMALTRSGMNADGQLIENVINLDGEVIYRNQKKVARRHGMSLTNR